MREWAMQYICGTLTLTLYKDLLRGDNFVSSNGKGG